MNLKDALIKVVKVSKPESNPTDGSSKSLPITAVPKSK